MRNPPKYPHPGNSQKCRSRKPSSPTASSEWDQGQEPEDSLPNGRGGGVPRLSSEGGGVPDAHRNQAKPAATRVLLRGACPGPTASGALWVGRPCSHCGGGVTLRSVSGRSHGGPGEPPSKVRASRPQIDVSSKTAPLPVFPPQA